MTTILLTCEHAAKKIPRDFSRRLNIPADVLNSHRGWDPGALPLCTYLQKKVSGAMFTGEYSRLLIDLNRSPDHKNLFSEYSKKFTAEDKSTIIKKFYLPYRENIENFVAENVRRHKLVVHFSIHSFTPELKGKTRKADIGILFDPDRSPEVKIADQIRKLYKDLSTNTIIRKNYPYRGVTDGMASYLRKKFLPLNYIGLELEINQNIILNEKKNFELLKKNLSEVLQKLEFLSV